MLGWCATDEPDEEKKEKFGGRTDLLKYQNWKRSDHGE